MPAIVPHTSTYALTNSTFEYALGLADHGLAQALRDDRALHRAVNVMEGHVTHRGVAEAFDLATVPLEQIL
jgi:alanine dehydrogenase